MPKKDLAELRKIRKERMRRADDQFTWRVLGVMVFLGIWTFLLYRFNWPVYLYALPAGAAVLYLLAYIYPRDFIVLAVFVSGGALCLWLLTLLYQGSGRVYPARRLCAGSFEPGCARPGARSGRIGSLPRPEYRLGPWRGGGYGGQREQGIFIERFRGSGRGLPVS